MTELAQAPSQTPEEPTAETSRKKGSGPALYPSWSRYFKKLVSKAESQTEVSQKLDLSQAAVSRWTRGLARPANLEAAVEAAVKLGGDGQEAADAFSADPTRTRGGARTRKSIAKKAAAAKKSGPKPGRKAAKKATATSTRSSRSEETQSTPVRRIAAARGTQPARVAAVPDLPADLVADVAEADGRSFTDQAIADLNDAIAAVWAAEQQLDTAIESVRSAGVPWARIGLALSRLNGRSS